MEPCCLSARARPSAQWEVTHINRPSCSHYLVIGLSEDQSRECRPDLINAHMECIGQSLLDVESNLACADGKAELTACDSHPNSSIPSLTTRLSSNPPGQTTHRMHLILLFQKQQPTLQQSSHNLPRLRDSLPRDPYYLRVTRPHFSKFALDKVVHHIEFFSLSAVRISPSAHSNCSNAKKEQMLAFGCLVGELLDCTRSDSSSPADINSGLYNYCVEKSVSISEQAVITETQDLNSICKYLPTSDPSDRGRPPARLPLESESMHKEEQGNVWHDVSPTESTGRYRFYSPQPAKRCAGGPLARLHYLLLFLFILCELQAPVK